MPCRPADHREGDAGFVACAGANFDVYFPFKVYMMLGMNDVAVYGIDGAIKNYCKLMDLILENAPEVLQ